MYLKKFIYLQKPINTIVIVILQYKDIVIYTIKSTNSCKSTTKCIIV